MLRVPRSEGTRLFKYVTQVNIEFCPWNEKSNSSRELWRRLTSKRLQISNPKAIIDTKLKTNIAQPTVSLKYVDGSDLVIADASTMTVDELISQMNIAAVAIDNVWVMEGKDLGDEEA
jgi:hypothetical protein